MVDPPFRSVGIAGLGLIGASIALAVRRAWPGVAVVGVDRPEVTEAALRGGIVTIAVEDVTALDGVELVVLAAPVPEITKLIQSAGDAGLEMLVTDVGSTKRQIMADAAAANLRFVGGHPIAGAAAAGLSNARADLFVNREWLIVPGGALDSDVSALEQLARGLGALPRRIDADVHDRVMAYVSHLPQLLATALMTAAGSAVGRDSLSMAGPGFADMTRLAASPLDIWRGILGTNADYIGEALQALVAALPLAGDGAADPARLDAIFRDAHKWSART